MTPSFKISERAQVVLILVFAVTALGLAVRFLLWPQFAERKANLRLQKELANNPYAKLSEETLQAAAAHAKNVAATLDSEWEKIARRISTLPNVPANIPRIAYQVEYQNVNQRLNVKAKSLEIKLPAGLDIDPAVASTESVRERLNQLKTVEKLADLVFDQRIIGITALKNLPTVTHHSADLKPICEEYPVEVTFSTYFDALFYLFSAIFDEDRVFVFSKIRVTSDPREDDILHIKAVMSSLIFL